MNVQHFKKIQNLFLQQSYLDSWEDYTRSLRKDSFIKWDYIILTASNEAQAHAFRQQIDERLKRGQLPGSTHYAVLPDPDGKRVGSGGATFNVLKYLAEREGSKPFNNKRILVIHSGGDSKRVPQYSAVGKLFSPVPRELPDGRASTLFDEFIISMSGVASRFPEGMLILSGDVLLLFNPLQIDAQFNGAAAISIKQSVNTGKDHGVFLDDGQGCVKNFLHKQSVENLKEVGAVDEHGTVDLDTGAILLDVELLNALYSLISTEGRVDEAKFGTFVNDRARVSFYGDMLYPLASASTLEQYYKEKPEGDDTPELYECRTKLWDVLRSFSLKLIRLSPAQFIHFGTTHELLTLLNDNILDYEFLGWNRNVSSLIQGDQTPAAYEAFITKGAYVSERAYVEQSYILDKTSIDDHAIVSNVILHNVRIPEGICLHGLPLPNGKFVVRIYGVEDNPKGRYEDDAVFLNKGIKTFLKDEGLSPDVLWEPGEERTLWTAKLFPVSTDIVSAVHDSLKLLHITRGFEVQAVPNGVDENGEPLYRLMMDESVEDEKKTWLAADRISLRDSFNMAETDEMLTWQNNLRGLILCRKFIDRLMSGVPYQEALEVFGKRGMTEEHYQSLMDSMKNSDFDEKIRVYYAISRFMKENGCVYDGKSYDYPERLCFETIQSTIYESVTGKLPDSSSYRIAEERVDVQLPVRVNWGGGWTDTPPYCNDNGGVVLNAAISLNGILPIQITVKRLDEYAVEFESQDIGTHGMVYTTDEIQDCHNPYDPFALHKAALIACGIIPIAGGENLETILRRLGGGIYISTQVVGIPKGSGLGTSSILAGACVKGIFKFLGQEKTDNEIYQIVLCLEQIMSTGGGWQDQVGGLTSGIKFITTKPGIEQNINVEQVNMPEGALTELSERFALIYTGQRRLARNLLRDVVGGYIGGRPESVDALSKMQSTAALMKFYLERGDIDEFARLLNEHWELSKQLDTGSTNTCIDQIFLACEDMIDGKFIAGAGGGGFIMVILKKEVTKKELSDRLRAIFSGTGVDVWETEFV